MVKTTPSKISTPADILRRAERPQHSSSWIPRKRDWRYASGVYRHDDFEDDRERSTWDVLDWDASSVEIGRKKRGRMSTPRSMLDGGDEGKKIVQMRNGVKIRMEGSARGERAVKASRAWRIEGFGRGVGDEGVGELKHPPSKSREKEWVQTWLVAVFKFTGENARRVRDIGFGVDGSGMSGVSAGTLPAPLSVQRARALPLSACPRVNAHLSCIKQTATPVEYGDTGKDRKETPRLEINIQKETVKLQYSFQLRKVFLLPTVAMVGLVGEALKVGVQRAEQKMKDRVAKEEGIRGAGGEGVPQIGLVNQATRQDIAKMTCKFGSGSNTKTHIVGSGETQDTWGVYKVPKKPRGEDSTLSLQKKTKRVEERRS